MENSNDIIDTTLDVVNTSITNFDNALGKVPLYQAGHNVGSALSRLIDRIVDALPIENKSI